MARTKRMGGDKDKLFSQANQALKRAASLRGVRLIVFSLPAHVAKGGMVVCPLAGKFAEAGACYAKYGSYSWPSTRAAFERKLKASLLEDFVEVASGELASHEKQATKAGQRLFVRVHDAGDFYSREYLQRWLTLADRFPSVHFYAFTKSLPFVRGARKAGKVPPNFVFTFSQGGLLDRTIDPVTEKHTKMFATLEDLTAAGYVNATKDDLVASDPKVLKVGLVYHGSREGAARWGLEWKGRKAYQSAKGGSTC